MKKVIRKIVLLLLLFAGSGALMAQGNDLKELVEEKVNQQVWQPFKTSYETRDWKTFNSLHTDDVLRVHDGGIRLGQEYKERIRQSYQTDTERETAIDFVMERRMYKDHVGYEVGFYRVISKEEGKEDRISYGRFHVVLRKIDGVWKIAQDWDSNSFNGTPIGQNEFDEEKMLDLN